MFENELGYCDEASDHFPEAGGSGNAGGAGALVDTRRRIERLRELRLLREWLDDPELDDLE